MIVEGSAVTKGTVLMQAEPFSYVLQSKFLSTRCDFCLSNEEKVRKCKGCDYVSYCNQDCQKKAWKTHKFECKNMKRCQPLNLPNTARLIAKIIMKLKKGGMHEKGYYLADKYRTFSSLMSHSEEIKKSQKSMEHIFTLKCVLDDFLREDAPSFEELVEVYGRIRINSFAIFQDIETIATGIYLGPSILDHSCVPNVIVSFEGTKLFIRSLEDIPSYDVSKIRISYIDSLKSTEERKKELLESYYFNCTCTQCEKPDLRSNAMACPNTRCTNYCNINEEKCSQCDNKLDDDLKRRFKEVVQYSNKKLGKFTESEDKIIEYTHEDLSIVEECLKMQRGILHEHNVVLIRTLKLAQEIALKQVLFEKALEYMISVIPGYVEYYTKYHNVTIDTYLTAVKTALYLDKFKQAIKLLKEITPVVLLSYSNEHYYRKALETFAIELRMRDVR